MMFFDQMVLAIVLLKIVLSVVVTTAMSDSLAGIHWSNPRAMHVKFSTWNASQNGLKVHNSRQEVLTNANVYAGNRHCH
ncbi:hypothetical protein [Endozoicomonas sp. ONNA2]|uniref:hypothetical protein n=1 Tax=Endozoicomonas sp. ONNA2 TaxID=2828741 RepID=UPI002147DD90|nr:hypothetical protein [Endozoicomonas sp. ONNA2]